MITVDELRQMYLDFFASRGHLVLPSASLVPHGDPTLLLTGAGMVPFKPYFLGKAKPPRTRITTCQRCMRTGDIEQVGKTARHATFFEMLGNFSFGDYFKAEVIPWAWEFVTEHLRLPRERLWVSVYQDDHEAAAIWRQVGVPGERIVRLGKEDNFWEIGVGPCGPCSELHLDRGPEYGCGRPDCSPACSCDRFMEFWNLVFIQYHRDEEGNYHPLAQKGIDTGMGLERIAAIMQGVEGIFAIDTLRRLLEWLAALAGRRYGEEEAADISLRVITDHLRGATFMVSDGIIPGNEGRGYVLRRLLRRSLRHAHLLGIERPFLPEFVDAVIEVMQTGYPELSERREQIKRIIGQEEERFRVTLAQGTGILERLLEGLAPGEALPGEEAFKLYDTYGFPLELTREIAAERGIEVEEAGFAAAMAAQRERARAARAETGYLDQEAGIYADLALKEGLKSEFVGYAQLSARTRILALLQDGEPVERLSAAVEVDEAGSEGDSPCLEVILAETPFYAESGGQVADEGEIVSGTGACFQVKGVRRPVEGLIVQSGRMLRGTLSLGEEVEARVESERRAATARNHTATHLLQRALKDVLGEHVQQAGSLVTPTRLRFDFTHPAPLTAEERRRVERVVAEKIMANLPVEVREMRQEEARALGATTLFTEKYGEIVRVVSIGDYSRELCGGTHARSTGEIGYFKLLEEGSVAAGTRRLEACTGAQALAAWQAQEEILSRVAGDLHIGAAEVPEKVVGLLAQQKELVRTVEELKRELLRVRGEGLLAQVEEIAGVKTLIAALTDLDGEDLRTLGDTLRDRLGSAVVVLGSRLKGKVIFLALVTKDLLERGLHAGNLVRELAKLTGGGGGGRPDLAQAGGKQPEKLAEALARARELVTAALGEK